MKGEPIKKALTRQKHQIVYMLRRILGIQVDDNIALACLNRRLVIFVHINRHRRRCLVHVVALGRFNRGVRTRSGLG